jgi:phosphocarrier protein
MAKTSQNQGREPALEREFMISNKFGIHARPAALFVKTASRYVADVQVERDGNKVSGKSIMGLMTLEASHGCTIRITAEGKDAQRVLEDLATLIENKFYED